MRITGGALQRNSPYLTVPPTNADDEAEINKCVTEVFKVGRLRSGLTANEHCRTSKYILVVLKNQIPAYNFVEIDVRADFVVMSRAGLGASK